MNKTNICIELRLAGDNFNPDLITEEIKIKPDQHWKVGDQIQNKNIKRNFSLWLLTTGYKERLDINELIRILYLKLEPKRTILKEIIKKLNLTACFDIIINIKDNIKPSMHLEKYIIDFASDTGIEFDFDIYTE